MKIRFYIILLGLLAGILGYSQSFTPGNIVVVRVGDGSRVLTDSTASVFLEEYTPGGAFVRSIPMPTSATGINKRLTFPGNDYQKGALSLSPDRRWLALAGIDAAPLTSLLDIELLPISRVIGLVDFYSMINTSTGLTDIPPGSITIPASAVSTNGTNIWTCVGSQGLRYTTLGSNTSAQVLSTTNNKVVDIYGGNLYSGITNGAITRVGIGLPTTGPQPIAFLITGIGNTGGAQNDYFFADLNPAIPGYDVIYLSNSGNNGGLRKFSFNGSTWTLNGKIGVATDIYGFLTGVVTGTTVTLYATRKVADVFLTGSPSEIVTLVDNTGHTLVANSFTGNPTLLATSQTNTGFRGIAMAPIKCKQPLLRLGATTPTSVQVFVSDSIDAGGPYEYAISTSITPPTSGNFVGSNTINDASLSPGIHYYIHVRRNCGGGDFSAWANIDFTTTWPPCTAPANFTQGVSGSNTIINWDQVFTAIKYEYKVTTDPSPTSSGQFVTGPTVSLPGLLSAKQYYLHVRAYCGGGDTSAWSTKLFTTPCFTPAPYLIANNWQAGTAEIGWSGEGVDQVFEYAILSSEAPVGGSIRIVYDTVISVNNLVPGYKYHLSVRQRCSGGTVSDWGKLEFNVSGAHVYPSPATNDIIIRVYGQKTDGELVHIYNANGQRMISLRLSGNTATTNVERWATGVYFVRFGNNHEYLTKIIKQ